MKKKQAFAVIYYVRKAFSIFENTFVEFPKIIDEENRAGEPCIDNIYCGLLYEDNFLLDLLYLSQENLGFTEKDLPSYDKLIKQLNVKMITLPVLKEAGKTLVNAMHMDKKDVDDIGAFLS